ncbi:Monomeric sarcosine oxidase [Pirellulimonas nuda]|uniref:Monomeric sarcosine oxidase n=1 Tax=Pirellulimonas nuda TaxID=2528009 RepID=A0A518D9M5_9BACT|nr:N-methyl-L-tryptophan oxidase [Pirellulimonas nuda]QDU88189.1 Monomeric sarcosine oxidase [Pirellulimonas nuda]
MPSYDAIVIGAGGVGSAAMWRLARRGLRVLGIDRFAPPHSHGSSHGHTRMIRQAYFEHPDYVPLALRSYALWAELEAESGAKLFCPTGLVEFGPADGVVVPGVKRAASTHGLPIEPVGDRWPQFRVPEGCAGVFEPTGGVLFVERCVESCLKAARTLGAELVVDTEVLGWVPEGDGFSVQTSGGAYRAGRLVITVGPWACAMLGEMGVPLRVRRKSLFWFGSDPAADASLMPPFLFELPSGVYYGLPSFDARGVKVGDHAGGQPVDDPLLVDRSIDLQEEADLKSFVSACIPAVTQRRTDHAVCLYTMSPDEHFIVDHWPHEPRVVFAAGLSGHGFKFAPVLGEALADLAIDGASPLPVGFLGLSRFATAGRVQRG